MTALQRLQLKQSETRQALNILLALDELDDEQRAEMATLTTSMQGLETELRAAIVAEPDPTVTATEGDAAATEMRALISGASIGGIFEATLEHRQTDGVTAELQTELGLHPNQIPLALLETRAVTPAPANTGATQSEIVPGVFPQSAAAFLGISMPTVAVGDAIFPVLTTNATVGTPAENAAQAETTGSFTAEALSSSRLQASYFYSRESRAKFAGMDEALRMNLSEALSDALDKEIISGANGLLTGSNLAPNAAAAATTYATYRSGLAYARVDGQYASATSDLRILMGSGTYAHAAGQFRADTAGDRSAGEDLAAVTAGVRVSAHVPAVASNKQNAVVRLGMRRDMVAPIWEGVTLIPDEITQAGKGQIIITAVMMHAVKILRVGGFYKQETQHA